MFSKEHPGCLEIETLKSIAGDGEQFVNFSKKLEEIRSIKEEEWRKDQSLLDMANIITIRSRKKL